MNTSHFGVEDRAIGQGFTKDRSRNGMPCTIIGGLEWREFAHLNGSLGKSESYLVRWADGLESIQEPRDLALIVSKRAAGPGWGFCGLNPCGAYV